MRNLSWLLLLAAICAAAVVWNRGTWQGPAPVVTPEAPTKVAPAAATAETTLSFESTPPGAEVVGPAGSMGVTPFSLDLAGQSRPKSVLYRLAGYYTQQRKVAPDAAVVTATMLSRQAPGPKKQGPPPTSEGGP